MAFNDMIKIFLCGVSSVQPAQLISRNISFNESNNILNIVNKQYDLTKRDLYVVGAGKAVYDMVLRLSEIVGSQIRKGIVSVPKGSLKDKSQHFNNIKCFEGAKDNIPDNEAVFATQQITDLVKNIGKNSLLIVLLSGGGSALLSLPLSPVTLEEKVAVIKSVVRCGATINELNTIRKKLSAIKGGKLVNLAPDTDIVTLILSDVIGDPIDLIASGPTVQDEDAMDKAVRIIEKYNLQNEIPLTAYNILYNSTTCYADNLNNGRVLNHVIGNNTIALESVRLAAFDLGYDPLILSDSVQGDVKNIAKLYVNIAEVFCRSKLGEKGNYLKEKLTSLLNGIESKHEYRQSAMTYLNSAISQNSVCLILGGEPTVKLSGNGKGGRNQELALQLSTLLHTSNSDRASPLKQFEIEILCAGTDGIDGPTDAAGAFGYSLLVNDSLKQNLDPQEFLSANDSYNFYKTFRKGKCHLKTGHTNTNVMDIHIIKLSIKN